MHPEVQPAIEFEARWQAFRHVVEGQMSAPPGGDVRIAAYNAALNERLDHPGPVHDFFAETVAQRPDIGPSYLVNKSLRAGQRQLYEERDDYPLRFDQPRMWGEALDDILADYDRGAEFFADVWTRQVQSNVSDRYKTLKAFGLLAVQFGRLREFSVLDVGCSQNAGLNDLASGVPFTPPEVARPGSRRGSSSLPHTSALRQLLEQEATLEPSVGVDLTAPADSRLWAWSCSHYPSELLDEERVALFEKLILAQYDNVSFFKGDFANFDTQRFAAQYGDRTFGIVNFCTSLYQGSQEERAAMLATAEQYAEEFIIVQDFLRINPEHPSQLIFRDNWQDDLYPYRTVIRDMRDPFAIWHEAFMWRDGRCKELMVGLGRVATTWERSGSVWRALDGRARQMLQP